MPSSSSCRPATGASRQARKKSSGSSPRRRCRRYGLGSPASTMQRAHVPSASISKLSRRACSSASICSCSGRADERDGAAGRGHRPPAASDPRRHDEPAGQRDRRGRAASRLPRRQRSRLRADREGPGTGRPIYEATVAQKMTAPFRLRVRGRSGHASMPGIADNALVKAARLIERLAAFRPEPQLGPEVEGFLSVVLDEVPPALEAVARTRQVSGSGADIVEALLAPTFSPTMVSASLKRNVIPAICEVEVDCRLLPGQHPEHVEPLVRAVLGGDVEYQLEPVEEARGATRSPLDTPLWRTLEEWVAEAEPGAKAAPLACAGFTDSHYLRAAFDTVAYGFFPATGELPSEVATSLVHSADERIPVSDLELAVGWLRHAARAMLG